MSQLHNRVNFPVWVPVAISGLAWGLFRIIVNLDLVFVAEGKIDAKIMTWVKNAFLIATGFHDNNYLSPLFTAFFMVTLGIVLLFDHRIVLWKKRQKRPTVLNPDKLDEFHRILKGK